MNTLEANVIARATEWYAAKQAAEINAGQPVNWTDSNFDRLEEAIKELVEHPEPVAYGWEAGII